MLLDKNQQIQVVLSRQECQDFQEALKLAIYRQGQSLDDWNFLRRAVNHFERLEAFIGYMDKGQGGDLT